MEAQKSSRKTDVGLTICIVILSFLGLLLVGCATRQETVSQDTSGVLALEDTIFVPPEDGKITQKQAEAYVKASVLITRAIQENVRQLEELASRQGVGEDSSVLTSSTCLDQRPHVRREYEEIGDTLGSRTQEAYRSAGITEEEFFWIDGALTDPANKTVLKEVGREIEEELDNARIECAVVHQSFPLSPTKGRARRNILIR